MCMLVHRKFLRRRGDRGEMNCGKRRMLKEVVSDQNKTTKLEQEIGEFRRENAIPRKR